MRYIIPAVLVVLIMIATSGCVGEKTVIKANITITGEENSPAIENIRVTTEKVSNLEDYSQASTRFPGVYMKCISNKVQIDYWRSVDYHGAGDYEIISELARIPEKGESVDVIISVVDINGDLLAKKTQTIIWE